MNRLLSLAIIFIGLSCFSANSAHAFHWYWDFGGGVAKRTKGVFGMSYLGGAAIGLNNAASPILFHVGVEGRGAIAGGVTTNAVYGILRIEWKRVFIGGGYSPFIMDSNGLAVGVTAYMGQAGYLFSITPEIAFYLGGAFQTFSKTSVSTATFDGIAAFRLFYGESSSEKSGSGMRYEGYRYPYGVEKYNK